MFNSTTLTKLILLISLIPIGLLTKVYSGTGSEFVSNHLGGVIYVIFWIILFSCVFPKYSLYKLVSWVLLVTCSIEFTQLIHTPTLELFRKNFIFRALFGSTYNSFDFIWYFVGALLGFILILILVKISDKISYAPNTNRGETEVN